MQNKKRTEVTEHESRDREKRSPQRGYREVKGTEEQEKVGHRNQGGKVSRWMWLQASEVMPNSSKMEVR